MVRTRALALAACIIVVIFGGYAQMARLAGSAASIALARFVATACDDRSDCIRDDADLLHREATGAGKIC